MRGTVGRFWLAWLAAAAGAAGGCSLFDEVGGGKLSFDLPPANFQIDPADHRWWPSPPGGVPDVVCRGPAALVSDCCQPPPPMNVVDCQEYPLGCDDDGMCALAFDYDDAVSINLGRDVPALQDQSGWILAQATVDGIDIAVPGADARADAGVAPLPLRTLGLYVAPQGAVSAGAAGAMFLADIPWRSEPGHVDLSAQAQIALSSLVCP